MWFRSIHLSALFIILSVAVSGQYYDTGQDPANLKWLQIKTDRFTVIYPEKYGLQGIEFTRSLEKAYSDLISLFPDKKFRIPVIIHNYTTQNNGYVAWAPKRMEVFPTPEQNSIPLDAKRQLALHELTHVMQMELLNTGFSKAMSIIFGQQFPGAVASLLPLWYMEGDAVFAESALSGSGRGRSAAFQKQLKAIAVEKGKMYKYDKILNGSYRSFIPDHYKSGYQIVAWTLTRYNLQTWNKAVKFTGNFPFTINPVNISLLKNIGLTKKKLFNQAYDTLTKIWSEEISGNNARAYEALNPIKQNNYINYYSPVKAGENNFAAVKTSLSNPPEFVFINSSEKTEKRIRVPGNIFPYVISGTKRVLVWVEAQPDPRWNNRNYSVIKIMDLHDKIIKQLTWKSRYMSASISPDGKEIAATENTFDNKNYLVILNISTGKVTKSFPVPGNAYLQRPQWSDDGTKIIFISLNEKGEGILSFKLSDQTWDMLIKNGSEDFQSAFLRHDSLFYVSSVSGTENIYVLPPDKKIMSLTNSKFGATDLLLDRNRIVFSDYTFSGNDICFTPLKNYSTEKSVESDSSFFLMNKVNLPESTGNFNTENLYKPVPYKKWQHLFGFHSWMPFYADIETVQSDPLSIKPGFTILSQNQLSSLITSLGYEYSGNLHKFHSQVKWKGWYPVLESRIDYGDLAGINKMGYDINNPSKIAPAIYFTNRLSVPLNYSTGNFSQNLQPSFSYTFENNYLYVREDSSYDNNQSRFSGRFYFSNYYRYAARDIYPRWAQIADINFFLYPFDKKLYGSGIILKTALFFPGIFKNNSLRFRYETEYQDYPLAPFYNNIHFPRSYKEIVSGKLDFVSFDYFAPLVYPDINISSILYLTRVRTGLFYDYGKGTDNYHLDTNTRNQGTETFRSFGIELLTDFYLFRIPFMMSGGVQAAWREFGQLPVFEFLFNIDIYGMSIGRRRL